MFAFTPSSLLEIVVRSTVVYLMILIAFRLAGKRHISQLSVIDFALVLLVSNAVQNAMVGNDTSLIGGLIAAATLIVINLLLTLVGLHEVRLAKFLEGEPKLLVRNGQYIHSSLAAEAIRPEELEEQIREHGYERIEDVRLAFLEIDGSISVIPFSNDTSQNERTLPFVRHRHRSRRGLRP